MTAATVARTKRPALGETVRECPLCESPHLEYEFVVDGVPVCGCHECGLLFLNPPMGADQAAAPAQADAEGLSEIHRINAAERLDQLTAYSNAARGRLLLVGADEQLASEARSRGFDVHAFSPRDVESANAAEWPAEIDACILFCALERMRQPLTTLRTIRSALQPGGVLMVISPTTDSKAARLLRSSWWEFNRANVFYFSTDTLQSLLVKAGFGDPIIAPERSLVSLNYLRRRMADSPRKLRRYKWMRQLLTITPAPRNRTFRGLYGRTRFLVRPVVQSAQPLLSVIIPVYNERATVCELIERVAAKNIEGIGIEIIIVESNSTDGSRELVLQYRNWDRVRIVLEDKPLGKGHAVRAGLEIAKGNLILFQDADLEYDINDYDALLAPLLTYRQNFVLGSRHMTGKNNWKIRQFTKSPILAAFFNLGHLLFLSLFNLLYSQHLSDPFTMFKVFRRDCLYGLDFECNRFDFDYEIVIKFLRKGYRPLELPVNYRSRSLGEGKKVAVFRDPPTWLRALFRFRSRPLYRGIAGR